MEGGHFELCSGEIEIATLVIFRALNGSIQSLRLANFSCSRGSYHLCQLFLFTIRYY